MKKRYHVNISTYMNIDRNVFFFLICRPYTTQRIILKSRYLNKIKNNMSSLHQNVITLIGAADTLSQLIQIIYYDD